MALDRLAGFLLATFLTIFSGPICEGQSSSDTDYVVMFDTSMSMNKPPPPEKPTLAEVKLALKEMVRESWLPESKRQDEPARLYFYPFDDPPEARRVFLLTESGVNVFEDYLEALEARGSNTCIIDTLEKVLEEVPQTAKRDGRICRRQYILLTDGEENCREDWVTQELLEKELTKWGRELKVNVLSDSLFLLRVGQFRNPNAENNFEELSRQAEKSAKGKQGTPVQVGRSAPDPVAIRKLLEPPRYMASPSRKSIALAAEGAASIPVTLTGSNLPAKKPEGLSLQGKFKKTPKHSRITSDSRPLSDADWLGLKNNGELATDIGIEFDPPAGVDVEDDGVLVWELRDGTGVSYGEPFEVVIHVSSKGKAEVQFAEDNLILSADRIDNRTTTHSTPISLRRDPAVDTRDGRVSVSSSPTWPENSVTILIDGQPIDSDVVIDFAGAPGLTTEHQVEFIVKENLGATQYGGALIFKADNCQLKSGKDISNQLEIPWRIEGEEIPPSLVTLEGQLPINGKLAFEVESTGKPGPIKVIKQIGFSLKGAAGAQAKVKDYQITVSDIELAIPQDNTNAAWVARDPDMEVRFDGKLKELGPASKLDAVSMEFLIPGDSAAGEYHGKVLLEVSNAKFTAQGLGLSEEKVELFWVVTVKDPPAKTISVVSPIVGTQIIIGKAVGGVVTNVPAQVVQVDFSEISVGDSAEVRVSVSPGDYFPEITFLLEPDMSMKNLILVVPGFVGAGEHKVDLRFVVEDGNIRFANGKKSTTRTVLLRVQPAPIPSASVTEPIAKKTAIKTPWIGRSDAEIEVGVDFSAEAKSRKSELIVSKDGKPQGRLTTGKPTLIVPITHEKGEINKSHTFRIGTEDPEFRFSNGKEFYEFTVSSEIVEIPPPEVRIDESTLETESTFDFPEEDLIRESVLRFDWNESAEWLGSRLSLRLPTDFELDGRARLVTIVPERDSVLDSRVEQLKVVTSVPVGTEPGTYVQKWEFLPEGDLKVNITQLEIERVVNPQPRTMVEWLTYGLVVLLILLSLGFVAKKVVAQKFGDPTFPKTFYCDVQSEEFSNVTLRGAGLSTIEFGGGTSTAADYPVLFKLTAVKGSEGLLCKVDYSEVEEETDFQGKVSMVRFDINNESTEFVSGEIVSSEDRLELMSGSTMLLELTFRGLSDPGVADDDDDFPNEEFDDASFDDFDD